MILKDGDMLVAFLLIPAICVALVSSAVASQTQDRDAEAATVHGHVADGKSGKPVRTVVRWTRQTTPVPTTLPFTGAVTSGEDGTFRITGLAPGTYVLCIHATGSDYLDPCKWSPTAPKIELAAKQRVENFRIEVAQGVRLEFDVADRENRVQTSSRPQGVRLSAYIPLPAGRRIDLPLVRTTGVIHKFEILVPGDRDVPVVVEGRGLQFTDLNGSPWGSDRAAYVISKPPPGTRQQKAEIEAKGR